MIADIRSYERNRNDIKLDPDDTLQLVLESETEEEKNFY